MQKRFIALVPKTEISPAGWSRPPSSPTTSPCPTPHPDLFGLLGLRPSRPRHPRRTGCPSSSLARPLASWGLSGGRGWRAGRPTGKRYCPPFSRNSGAYSVFDRQNNVAVDVTLFNHWLIDWPNRNSNEQIKLEHWTEARMRQSKTCFIKSLLNEVAPPLSRVSFEAGLLSQKMF